MHKDSRVRVSGLARIAAPLALVFAIGLPAAAIAKPKVGPTGPTGPTGQGVTEIPFGSGTGDPCSTVGISVLDASFVDFMGPGRILENSCNALEGDLMPRAVDVQMPVTRAGHASNLSVTVLCQNATDLGAGQQWTFVVENNGSDTQVTCAAAGPLVGTTAPFATTCQDTTHSSAFTSGDRLSVKITPVPMGGPADHICVVSGAVVEFGP